MGKLSKLLEGAQQATKVLDMAKEARMKRARDMGFDTDRVFTTRSPDESITEIHNGGRFGGLFTLEADDSPHGFGDYTHQFFARAGKVADDGDWDLDSERAFAFLKKKFPELPDEKIHEIYDLTAGDKDIYQYYNSDVPDGVDPMSYAEMNNPIDSDLAEASWEAQKLRGQIAADQGFDAIAMSDEYGTSYLFPHGSKARSVNAAFDPEKADSSNLMAQIGGMAPMAGLGALAATQGNEAEASVMPQQAEQPSYLSQGMQYVDTALDTPLRAILAASSFPASLASGQSMMEAYRNARKQFNTPSDETLYQIGDRVAEQTGSPAAGTAAYAIPQLMSPL